MSKVFLIDLDGTMFHGTRIIEDAKKFIDECYQRGLPYYFLTNNSSRTQAQAAKHMQDIGFEHVEAKHFYTSAMAAVDTVCTISDKRKAFYVGKDGIKNVLLEKGFEITEENPDFVFVGLDKEATYNSYSTALKCLLNGAKLVGTNNDRVLLHESGMSMGNGSIVAMFEHASSQKSLEIGKPHRPIMDCCLKYINKTNDEVMIIGDNLETDILCGINSKVESVLVTTGVHQVEDCERLGIQPDRIINSMLDLLNE